MSPKHDKRTDNDVVDVEAVRHESATRPERGEKRHPLVDKVLGAVQGDKVEAARAKVRDQFQKRVGDARERLGALEKKVEKKAQELVETVQATAQVARDKVREEGSEARHKLEQLRHDVGQRLPGLEHWLTLPDDVREDLLTTFGVASQKQVAALQEDIAGLRAEITAQFVAQTEILASLVEHAEGTAQPAAPSAAPRPASAKARGRKTPPAQA